MAEESYGRNPQARSSGLSFVPAPPSKAMASSRILNADGSIPKSTDELIERGFQKLLDARLERHRNKLIPPRYISNSSSKSSTTYVCSSPERASRPNIPRPQDQCPANSSSSADVSNTASATTASEDTGARLRVSLEDHDAKIRAMQAEIAALKRAASLTRELREEQHAEQATNLTRELREERYIEQTTRARKLADLDGTKRKHMQQKRGYINGEPYMSGGNGTGEEKNTSTTKQSRPIPDTHDESMDGKPSPPFDGKRPKITSNRQGKKMMCICPRCISQTKTAVNFLLDRYAKQDDEINSAFPACQESPEAANSFSKSQSILMDQKNHSRPSNNNNHSHQPPTQPNSSNQPHRKSMSNLHSPAKITGKENSKPASIEYLRSIAYEHELGCECSYMCKFVANREKFERENAVFPPYDRNGVMAKGQDRNGHWFW